MLKVPAEPKPERATTHFQRGFDFRGTIFLLTGSPARQISKDPARRRAQTNNPNNERHTPNKTSNIAPDARTTHL
jgi:hypothetical protein